MRYRVFRNLLYRILFFVQWASTLLIAVLSACLKADLQHVRQRSVFLAELLAISQDWAWILLLVFSLGLGFARLIRGALGSPWVWGVIHGILTEFQRHVFEKESGVQYHHRVTLFRRRFGLGPLPGWLIAVERSGYTTRGRVAVFKAPADDPARAEGVAGTAWAQGKIVSKSRLPDLSLPATEAQMEAYAAESFVPVKWVKKRVEAGKLLACSLTAIPLEVRGKPWGVLVLDSKSPDGIPDDHEQFRFIARILGKLLEGL